jgi:hypothetical protein
VLIRNEDSSQRKTQKSETPQQNEATLWELTGKSSKLTTTSKSIGGLALVNIRAKPSTAQTNTTNAVTWGKRPTSETHSATKRGVDGHLEAIDSSSYHKRTPRGGRRSKSRQGTNEKRRHILKKRYRRDGRNSSCVKLSRKPPTLT